MTARRRFLAWALPAAALSLAACGFHPVYMPGSGGAVGPALEGLSEINVGLIPERQGQMLRQYLQQRLDRNGGSYTKLYELSTSFSIAQEGNSISRADSVPTRTRLIGVANWSLVSMDADHHTVTRGVARSTDGFNPLDLQYFYSDLQLEQGQRRVAEAVAEQISLQLATWFSAHPPGA